MNPERWVIALVRYESSRLAYSIGQAELQEVVKVVMDHSYAREQDADRVLTLWKDAGRLSSGFARLPIEPKPKRLVTGRIEFYMWTIIPIVANVPGLQAPDGRVYQRLDRPYVNVASHPSRMDVQGTPWPAGSVSWFDRDAWLREQQGPSSLASGERPKELEYYGDVVYLVDQARLAQAMSDSIQPGCLLEYFHLETRQLRLGEVTQVITSPAANKGRSFIQWDVIRLHSDGLPQIEPDSEDPIHDTVWPTTLRRLICRTA
ncbi:hypothetical protein [Paenibacillus pasadenensis]|uniref:hypothetical protein n=1 Tax=Paenibacillus pasadenensis TaxID=217090 RepID=UPI000C7AA708|nr:hypothetical protein [Paenibacillus pasadenensis]